ncbi:MAG: hypothetical protein PUD93_06980, partial [Lachnospiraceae bacterium]|nr:hypothetical protein [Lachnospiraceae bacterium]
MLTYFQNSDSKNAVDDATRMIDTYVRKVKSLPEVEAGYMTVGDWMDEMEEEIREAVVEEIREETEKRVREETIKVFIETLREFTDSKETVVAKVREKYPDYAESAVKLVEKYWQEN